MTAVLPQSAARPVHHVGSKPIPSRAGEGMEGDVVRELEIVARA
jgi:hypothetical protein